MWSVDLFAYSSSFFTSVVDLLGLLKWKQMAGKLKDILVTIMKVSGEEIVKVIYIYIFN